ncbi:MAG: phosphatidylglycerol lysyltransferase domain-containing protein [Bacteriovoracaceae bacterium]|nr:phosphatidylglycerol lysyltransferase domain-containing protein [Bacteriovoracaceae bacterium]
MEQYSGFVLKRCREEEKSNFKAFGDRTSSLLSLYPHFDSFTPMSSPGNLQYLETKKSLIVATEPMTSTSKRSSVIKEFFETKDPQSEKRHVIFPISSKLATELQAMNYHIWQVGVEPIFHLQEYFDLPYDVLHHFPLARALKKRGGVVKEIEALSSDDVKEQLLSITKVWKDNRGSNEFQFLNKVDPFFYEDLKRFFVLEDRQKVVAYLTATPIFLNQQVIGYFFNDIIRGNQVRAGTNELLILEAMRMLKEEGIHEVRLGMCPLAEIDPHAKNSRFLTKIFDRWQMGYQFKKLYQFKKKFNPTKFEPLYFASSSPKFSHFVSDVLHAHYPERLGSHLWQSFKKSSRKNLELKSIVDVLTKKEKISSVTKIVGKIPWTLGLASFFVGLHLVKNYSLFGKTLFDHSGYIPGQVSSLGVMVGPLFHNHLFHLIGDQLSFVIFAGAIEYMFGSWLMLFLTSVGLWLSNPMTHVLLSFTVPSTSEAWWNSLLVEKDYGSSNAVFVLVGAMIFSLKRNLWLFAPFLFHGLYIVLQRESLLAFHHLLAMYLGYGCMQVYVKMKRDEVNLS